MAKKKYKSMSKYKRVIRAECLTTKDLVMLMIGMMMVMMMVMMLVMVMVAMNEEVC